MAKSIEFPPPLPDPRERLLAELQAAPAAHAEALLEAYRVLQLLHDKGILELTKGALGSGEKVLLTLTKIMETTEGVSFLRNLTTIVKILGGISPELLEDVQRTLVGSAVAAKRERAPGFLGLFRRLTSGESRRSLSTLAGVLEVAGRHLGEGRATATSTGRPPVVYRHQA